MCLIAGWEANSVDPDQILCSAASDWVYTDSSSLSLQILKVNTVDRILDNKRSDIPVLVCEQV